MVVHIIPDQKFTPEFCSFVRSFYPSHFVVVYFYGKIQFCANVESDKVVFVDITKDFLKNEAKTIKRAKLLFVHSLLDRRMVNYLFFHKRLLKKSVFIAWGGDIYDDYLVCEKDAGISFLGKAKRFLNRAIKKSVISKFPKYMTFANKDYDFMKGCYGAKGKSYDCLYPSTVKKVELDRCRKKKLGSTISILVGNSAARSNNDIEALLVLKKYSNEDIRIICPLSYGDPVYAKEVMNQGYALFGEKFIPLLNYMTPEEYASILSQIDVTVFFHDRQQATGNIEILSYYGSKIFIKSTISTWNHYVERDGCVFFDALTIENLDFIGFIRYDEKDRAANIKYFQHIWDDLYIKSKWDVVLNDL